MFSLPKTYFGLLTTKLVALKFRSQKTAFFVSKNYTFDVLSYQKKCSGLLATKLGWFEPHVTKNSVFPFLCLKYPAFSLNTGKTCFGLFAVKLGCYQHYCT